MRSQSFLAGFAALLPAVLANVPDAQQIVLNSATHNTQAPVYFEYTSKILHDTKLRAVQNSGVCETTPGVDQLSGYIDVATNQSMWFWFFEARHNSETAPFTLWLNGGPGCSSMIGLFQENGPCQVKPDNVTTVLNPYSWNNLSNIIYIDQPIDSGFSYGAVDVNSTWAAAPAVWKAFQILFESPIFARFKNRDLILSTESYGGHYGPEFITYFNEQNAQIEAGAIQGQIVNFTKLLINNGWYDPLIQTESYVRFAMNAPGYGPLQSPDVLASIYESYYGWNGCRTQLNKCYAAGDSPESNDLCRAADEFCLVNVETPAHGDRDEYDLRQNTSAPDYEPFPPPYYVGFLQNSTIAQQIGARVRYEECSDRVGAQFNKTGDDARSLLPQLAALADAGMKILIWAGDADINCNWVGGHASVLAMDWYGNETLHNTPLTNITLHGETIAAVQNVDNFTFARVYHAGHEVPAFQPEASFEIFAQILRGEQLHSVP